MRMSHDIFSISIRFPHTARRLDTFSRRQHRGFHRWYDRVANAGGHQSPGESFRLIDFPMYDIGRRPG